MPIAPKILLVGHCTPDAMMLRTAVSRIFDQCTIESVNTMSSLVAQLSPDAVLLVNRVLDGDFASDCGIELIRTIAAAPDAPPAMLISNFPEAQAQAIEAGAVQGFGKSTLYDADTAELLQAVVAL